MVKQAAQSNEFTLVGNVGTSFEDKNENGVPDEYEDLSEKLLLLNGGSAM